jgi:hypothetical protein
MLVIYGIVHKDSGRTYVGCTSNKTKRFREHHSLLNRGKHNETSLQFDWSLYGPSAFELVVFQELLEDATLREKRKAELEWLYKFKMQGLLYNRTMASFQFTPEATKKGIEASRTAGRPVSPEGRMKRRMAQLGVPKNHGHKISATKRLKRMLRLRDEIV